MMGHVAAFFATGSACPWHAHAGLDRRHIRQAPAPIYSPEERLRRDRSVWTLVQGVLAPLQFLVFLISLVLVVRYLSGGQGYGLAVGSIVVKTGFLYAIMITGAIWEKVVFGRFLFARPFFWEDVVSMLVMALHTAYLGMLAFGIGDPRQQLAVALAGYTAYVINAAQFVLKLRQARLESPAPSTSKTQEAV
ncbi:MAG: 2-vinyl bacteriochlorophyllide hydratase [Maricaulaceae bacterium]